MSQFNVVEICAGAGGQSWGLERAGFKHLRAVEIDESAANTLRHNLRQRRKEGDPPIEEVVRVGDVADRSVWDPAHFAGTVDLFAGGVPCPPFSIAGKQLGASDERDLFAWAVQHVRVIKPKALMLENVRGLSMPRFAAYRQRVLDELAEQGYVGFWKLLQASDFEVPQLRPRFVLVALQKEFAPYFRWPDTSGNKRVTVAEALKPFMTKWPEYETWAKLANDIAPTIVGGSKKHGGADLGPTRAKRAWADMGVDAMGVADDDAKFDKTTPKLAEKLPKLTVRMVARIQGWDDWEEWPILGRKTSAYRQVGNAFPPPVAEAVGRSIAAALSKAGDPQPMPELDETIDHDPVYRVLKQAGQPLTEAAILRLLKEPYDDGQLTRRIAYLQRDFTINLVDTPSGVAYELGDFKGFIGQEDHERHIAFAGTGRSKIS
ncbi:DNA cytosine methyltransferase [Kineococcus indalonis]|uniref:DNA cytosine methyltransferase n=1 Tax=Kineococcus indalonis TaxID=2696566 RepID=UPI00141305C7|nr:DNA (cytosine-5-)-methyltransferase [Kineococcus indalonis]